MRLRFATRKLERTCLDERVMQRTLGAHVAKSLKLRIAELMAVEQMTDLLVGTGKWEGLTADRAGQWSAHLTRNWRLIVAQEPDKLVTVLVVELRDYH